LSTLPALVVHLQGEAGEGFCGNEEEARKEAIEVLRINPKFTVESYARILPYKYSSNKDLTIQGLRKAGLP
jgi:hypothetical protein